MNSRLILKTLATVALATLFAGCASPYGKSSLFGGYTDKQVEPGVYRVSYAGNGYTSERRAQVCTIYRCAELTSENGNQYFTFVEGQSSQAYNTDAGLLPLLVDANRTKQGHPLSDTLKQLLKGEEPTGLKKGVLGLHDKTWSSALIRTFKEKPDKYPDSFAAQEVLEKLGPEVRGKQAAAPKK